MAVTAKIILLNQICNKKNHNKLKKKMYCSLNSCANLSLCKIHDKGITLQILIDKLKLNENAEKKMQDDIPISNNQYSQSMNFINPVELNGHNEPVGLMISTGVMGSTCLMGPMGPTCLMGSTGPMGPTGCTGPTGCIESINKQIHIKPETTIDDTTTNNLSSSVSLCAICYFEGDLIPLGCCHSVCEDCLQKYLKTKIEDDGEDDIICPFENCYRSITDDCILKIGGEILFSKLQALQNKNFISIMCNECNNECQSCDNIAHCEYCNIDFCVSCKSTSCNGIDCVYEIKDELDELCDVFDNADVKKCPRCLMNLWKENGCAATKCPYCKVRFCWQCLLINSRLEQLYDHSCSEFNKYLDSDED